MIYGLLTSDKRRICRTAGLCLAVSMMTALSSFALCGGGKCGGRTFTADNTAKLSGHSQPSFHEITVSEPAIHLSDDSEKNEKAYEKLIREQKKEKKPAAAATDSAGETQSTTSTSAGEEPGTTASAATVSSQTAPSEVSSYESEEEEGAAVSNGMTPFNYNDVSSVASELNTMGNFAETIQPSSISWNAEQFAENGCVSVTMDSPHGTVVLDVKPLDAAVPESGVSGVVNGSDIADWDWLTANKDAGCNISTVLWKDADFAIPPVRGIAVGASLAGLTDSFLCVNGGANTLYKASDVIDDQTKLNAILAAENLYTFVGGRVYSIGSYLDKYHSYSGGISYDLLFEDCDYVVQYGCNSIMEHNCTTGSWIIEYAVKEDKVICVCFMNKSYYNDEQKTAISTNISSSGSESEEVTTQTNTHTEPISSTDIPADPEAEGNPQEEETEEEVSSLSNAADAAEEEPEE